MINLKTILNELTLRDLDRGTPRQYVERSRNINVRLLGKTPAGKYIYRTVTRDNDNIHHQWVRTLNSQPFTGPNVDVVVWCDCENFTYENEWLLWKNNASHVVNSNGEKLRVRNPMKLKKLCKHLVAVMKDLEPRLDKNLIPVAAPKKVVAPIKKKEVPPKNVVAPVKKTEPKKVEPKKKVVAPVKKVVPKKPVAPIKKAPSKVTPIVKDVTPKK